MELLVYIAIVLVAVLLALFSNKKNLNKYDFILFIFIFTIHSLVIRLSGFDSDIINYTNYMKSISFDIYYLREPVVWLGQSFLYSVLGNDIAVLLVFDLLSAIIIFISFKNFNLQLFHMLSFLVFFPIILGYQNIYRQLYAEIIFLLSMSLMLNKKIILAWGCFLIAVLSHNAAAIFFPVILYMYRPGARVFSIISVTIIPLLLLLAKDTKSSDATGASLAMFYTLFIFIVISFIIFSYKFILKRDNLEFLMVPAIVLIISVVANIILSSTSAERISMFGLIALYPYIAQIIERKYVHRRFMKAMLVTAGFIPILIFGTRVFII